jgi:hypothetical protein
MGGWVGGVGWGVCSGGGGGGGGGVGVCVCGGGSPVAEHFYRANLWEKVLLECLNNHLLIL